MTVCCPALVSEDGGHTLQEERPVPAFQVGAVYLHEEDAAQGHRDQARVAEPTEASLGPHGEPMVVLSVIPGAAEDQRTTEAHDGTCSVQGEEGPHCGQENLFRLQGSGSFPDREEEYYAEPGVAEAEPVAAEDANSTDSLTSPKVNCEERNVTGLENFTLKILNMSQVGSMCYYLSVSMSLSFSSNSPYNLILINFQVDIVQVGLLLLGSGGHDQNMLPQRPPCASSLRILFPVTL